MSSEDFAACASQVSAYLTGSERVDHGTADAVKHCLVNERELIDKMKAILVKKTRQND